MATDRKCAPEPEVTSRAGSKECACVTESHVDRNRKWTGTGSRCQRRGISRFFHLFWDGGPWFSVLDHEMALFYRIRVYERPPTWMIATRMRQLRAQERRFSGHSDDFPRFFLVFGPRWSLLDQQMGLCISNLRSWWSAVLDGRDAHASVKSSGEAIFRPFWWFVVLFSCIWSSMIVVGSADGALHQICVRDGPPSWMVATRMRQSGAQGRRFSGHSDDFPRFSLVFGPRWSLLDQQMGLCIKSAFVMVRHLGWSRRACVSQELRGDDFPAILMISRAFLLYLVLDDRCWISRWGSASNLRSWWSAVLDGRDAHASVWSSGETIFSGHSDDFPRFSLVFGPGWSLLDQQMGLCIKSAFVMVRHLGWLRRACVSQELRGNGFPGILMISRAFLLYLVLDDRCWISRWSSASNLHLWWSAILDGCDAHASVRSSGETIFRPFWWFPSLFSCIWSWMIDVVSADGALHQICVRDGPPSWMVATRMRQSGAQGRRFSCHSDDFPPFSLVFGPGWSLLDQQMGLRIKSAFVMIRHLGWLRRACVSRELRGEDFPAILMISLAFLLYLVLDDRCWISRWSSLSNLRSWWSAVLDGRDAHASVWSSGETISCILSCVLSLFWEFRLS